MAFSIFAWHSRTLEGSLSKQMSSRSSTKLFVPISTPTLISQGSKNKDRGPESNLYRAEQTLHFRSATVENQRRTPARSLWVEVIFQGLHFPCVLHYCGCSCDHSRSALTHFDELSSFRSKRSAGICYQERGGLREPVLNLRGRDADVAAHHQELNHYKDVFRVCH